VLLLLLSTTHLFPKQIDLSTSRVLLLLLLISEPVYGLVASEWLSYIVDAPRRSGSLRADAKYCPIGAFFKPLRPAQDGAVVSEEVDAQHPKEGEAEEEEHNHCTHDTQRITEDSSRDIQAHRQLENTRPLQIRDCSTTRNSRHDHSQEPKISWVELILLSTESARTDLSKFCDVKQ
jgi:hypothetical protein